MKIEDQCLFSVISEGFSAFLVEMKLFASLVIHLCIDFIISNTVLLHLSDYS